MNLRSIISPHRRLCYPVLTVFCLCLLGVFGFSPQAGGQQTEGEAGQSTPATSAADSEADGEGASPGQADFDEAVLLRIDAETPQQLEAVTVLLESSLAKGLSEENATFAKKILGSVLQQRGQQAVAMMTRVRGRRQLELRDDALRLLRKAVENDPTSVEAFLLIARLNLLAEGDRAEVTEATTRAIELLNEDPQQQSAALLLRALTHEDDDKKIEDLNAAIEADPSNLEALQARAALRMQADDVDGAIEDLEQILTEDPSNQAIAQAAVQQLVDMQRLDDALALISKTLQARPSEGMYRIRAILYRMQGKEEEALADLNKALAMQPKDPISLLQRAEIALSRDDIKSAKQDLRAAIRIDPRVAEADQTILVRCLIADAEGRKADAINDMKLLVARDPSNTIRQLQLSNLYMRDDRPRKAIEALSAVIDREPDNPSILRMRGDALLSVGEHADAIEDYERAIKSADESNPDLPGILNNLAWVLATSPNDEVRDGKRSVELGTRASELTEFKEAHILSTLAAGYAETGDFEKAIEWSTKAVELGEAEENEQLEQLQQEVESYRRSEPWREKQEVEENEVPILSPEDLIET